MSLYEHITRRRLAALLNAGAFGEDARNLDVDAFLGADQYHTAMIGACLGQLVDALTQLPVKREAIA